VSETQVTDGRISAIRPRTAWVACFENYRTMEQEMSVGLTQDHEWSGIRLVLTA
jgi:hypothetical protein